MPPAETIPRWGEEPPAAGGGDARAAPILYRSRTGLIRAAGEREELAAPGWEELNPARSKAAARLSATGIVLISFLPPPPRYGPHLAVGPAFTPR